MDEKTFNNFLIIEDTKNNIQSYRVCDYYGTNIEVEDNYIDAVKDARLLQLGFDEGMRSASANHCFDG